MIAALDWEYFIAAQEKGASEAPKVKIIKDTVAKQKEGWILN